MKRSILIMLILALFASLHPASAQTISTFVEDGFAAAVSAPPDTLNVHVSTSDGGAGNVPVTLDSLSLALVESQVQGPPAIRNFSPASGPVGTSVTIHGTNFDGLTAVRFGGVDAWFTNNSSSLTTTVVPTHAATGLISVVSSNGTAASSTIFCVVRLEDFTLSTNNGAITIERYIGAGGDVTIPDNIDGLPVTVVGRNAFYFCTGLTNVTVPNSIGSLEDYAFCTCLNLTNIWIGAGVTNIRYHALDSCFSLAAITVDALNPAFCSADGTLFDKQQTTLLRHPMNKTGSYTVPASVSSIGVQAFYGCSSLASVSIPDSVTGIEFQAFSDCTSLGSLTIPDSITNIGYGAFSGCTALKRATVGNGIASLDGTFYNCLSLTNVTIGSGVTNIGANAFCLCPSLKDITIPPGVRIIGDGAFANSTGLGDLTIPDSVTHIGGSAFAGCASLTSITLPADITRLADYLFDSCSRLGGISIPGSVSHIGEYVFKDCAALGWLTIPNSVTSIGWGAFSQCDSLTGLMIGSGVTNIEDWAFSACPKLEAITVDPLNQAFLSVDGVLFDKSRTTLIKYPEGKLGSYAVPSGVISISQVAFQECAHLSSVTIPNSVTNIGYQAFYGCPSLTGISFQGDAPGLGSSVFGGVKNGIIYYLPGTSGWDTAPVGLPTMLWNPRFQMSETSFGVRTNHFGFTIIGTSNLIVVVEACTDLVNPAWSPVGTNTLTGGSSYYGDPHWTNHSGGFYRLRSP